MEQITSFENEFSFLSNFYPHAILYDGIIFKSSEAAYQAAKGFDIGVRLAFKNLSPGNAKRLGREIELREDWEEVKIPIMREILKIKFFDPTLKKMLKLTAPLELIEGNHWNDTFWGVCRGEGENHLGKLLMEVRDA